MKRSERSAFTLVELLVVIVIIAMLAGLLLPAVIRGRETARRAQCENNQHELALAVHQYENAKGHLPGYIDSFGGVRPLSWATMVVQYLGEAELWKKWRDPNVPMANKYDRSAGSDFCRVDLAVLKCPSDTTIQRGDAALSYVANCGLPDVEDQQSHRWYDPQAPNSGLFFNRLGQTPSQTIRTERIADGASNTLLFSENVQATSWAPPLDPNAASSQWYTPWEAHVGMVWFTQPGSCSTINACLDATENPTSPNIQYARPSSYHPGGVVVTYADGHQDFLNQDIEYNVYRAQMTPKD